MTEEQLQDRILLLQSSTQSADDELVMLDENPRNNPFSSTQPDVAAPAATAKKVARAQPSNKIAAAPGPRVDTPASASSTVSERAESSTAPSGGDATQAEPEPAGVGAASSTDARGPLLATAAAPEDLSLLAKLKKQREQEFASGDKKTIQVEKGLRVVVVNGHSIKILNEGGAPLMEQVTVEDQPESDDLLADHKQDPSLVYDGSERFRVDGTMVNDNLFDQVSGYRGELSYLVTLNTVPLNYRIETFMSDLLTIVAKSDPERCVGREEVGMVQHAAHMHAIYNSKKAHRWKLFKKILDSKVFFFWLLCLQSTSLHLLHRNPHAHSKLLSRSRSTSGRRRRKRSWPTVSPPRAAPPRRKNLRTTRLNAVPTGSL